MANKKNEAKVRFTAETAQMNKEIKKADQELRELRSGLKLNAEEMKLNGVSADGLAKKHNILSQESEQYSAKIELLKQKLQMANELFGESSEESARLRVTINNTSAAYAKIAQEVQKAEEEIKSHADAMREAGEAASQGKGAYERLSDTIQKQKDDLEKLEEAYMDAVLMYGKNSTEAKSLAAEMRDLSNQLEDNEAGMEKLGKMAKKASGNIDELGDAAKDIDDGFTVAKGAVATFAGEALMGMVGIAKEGISTLYNLADETREYRNEMAKLQSSAQDSGYSAEFAKEKYMDMYAVLADETAANTTVSNFMAMKMSQEDMNTVLNAATGIWAKYGDSIPLDGLAESINETANAGTVTGNLADALNWAGINEDEFNNQLKACKTTQERQNLIVGKLDKTYGKLGESYKKTNKNVMDANRATAEYNDTMADLGAKMEPVTTSVKRGFAEVVEAAMDLVDADVDKAAEKIGDAFEWVADNLDTIVKIAGIGAGVLAGMFVVNKVSQFLNSIKTITTTMGLFRGATVAATAATEAQTVAQNRLNIAMNANPIGLIIAGIAAVTAATVAAVEIGKKVEEQQQKEREAVYGLSEAQNELCERLKEEKKTREEMVTAREHTVSGVTAEYDHYQKLADELSTLVDKNGKVKKGYEERVGFITTALAEATGIEIELTDGVIKNYDELRDAIEKVIEKKRAEAILSAYDAEYQAAITGQTQAVQDLTHAKEAQASADEKVATLQKQYNEAVAAYEENPAIWSNQEKMRQLGLALDTAKDSQEKANQAVVDAEGKMISYNATISNYEGLSAAIISGDTQKINDSMLKLQNSFITAETGTKQSLENQVQNMKKNYEDLKLAVESGTPGVTKEMVDGAKKMVDQSEAELGKFKKKAEKKAKEGMEGFGASTKKNSKKATDPAGDVADAAEKKLDDIDSESSGKNYNEGFGRGVSSNMSLATGPVGRLADRIKSTLRNKLDEHSPSRESYQDAYFYIMGFANSIMDNMEIAETAVEGMADAIKAPLKKLEVNPVNLKVNEDHMRIIETRMNSQLQSEMVAVENMIMGLKNMSFVLNINGHTFATATAGDCDGVNGTRILLRERGLAV